MEKILVTNGTSLPDFTFELMTGIYHPKNIMFYTPFVGFLFFQTGPLEDHFGLGKYHGSTLTCLYVYSHGHSHHHIRRAILKYEQREGTENLLHNRQQWDNLQLCVLTSLVGLGAWVGTAQPTLTMRMSDCCFKTFRMMQIPAFCLLVLIECSQHAGCSSAKHPAGWFIAEYSLIKGN